MDDDDVVVGQTEGGEKLPAPDRQTDRQREERLGQTTGQTLGRLGIARATRRQAARRAQTGLDPTRPTAVGTDTYDY